MFKVYYADFFPNAGITVLVALVWRIVTYYSYLIADACIVPHWIRGQENKSHIGITQT